MKIGIDYTVALKQGGGIGRITSGLVKAVAELDRHNHYRLIAAADTRAPELPAANFESRRLPLSERALNVMWHRLNLPVPVEAFAGALDVFHAPNFTLPPVRSARSLVTIHDLSFLHYPEGAMPSLRNFLARRVPVAARRSAQIIADSLATKEALIEWLSLPAEKITVVYAGVGAQFQPVTDESRRTAVREKYSLRRPYVLGLGTLEPRKNFVGLVRAFEMVQQEHPAAAADFELVIAGRPGWLHEPIVQAARSARNVRLLGYVDDADLPALYSLASLYCLPSHYEGFGIPCIEAMACGTPVVCSNRPCLPEVVGDAALLVSPDDVEGLGDALWRVLTDDALRHLLITRGLARAREFPWARGARVLLSLYQGSNWG